MQIVRSKNLNYSYIIDKTEYALQTLCALYWRVLELSQVIAKAKNKQTKALAWIYHLEISWLTLHQREDASSKIKAGRPKSQIRDSPDVKEKQFKFASQNHVSKVTFNIFIRRPLHLFFFKGNFLIELHNSFFSCDTGFIPLGSMWLFIYSANRKGGKKLF